MNWACLVFNLLSNDQHWKVWIYFNQAIWVYAPQSPLCCVLDCVFGSVLPRFDYSPLGESVTAGIECMLGSAMYLKSTGMSLKKKKGTKRCEYTPRWVKHWMREQPEQPRSKKNSKGKDSQSCGLFTTTAVCAVSKMLVTEEETAMVKNQAGSPLQLQYVNNSMQSERSFWCCTANCTAIQLFINPFFALSPCLLGLSCSVMSLCFARDRQLGHLIVSGPQKIFQI